MSTMEKARSFIYRNARPVELARWQYHFEGGSRENMLHALSFYQNADGGFGHALEADSFNPNSSPITTLTAIYILREIGWRDGTHPMVQGILRYLDSGADFDAQQNQWLNTVPTNNDYPHAIWWGYDGKDGFQYNPTAGLVGFILQYAAPDSALYRKGVQIAQEAVAWFMDGEPCGDEHVISCFVLLYQALQAAAVPGIDVPKLESRLRECVNHTICKDTARWATDYVAKPLTFGCVPGSLFYEGNEELARYQCQLLKEIQLPDGSYPVPWTWCNDYPDFPLAANWWKSVILIENMLYLKGIADDAQGNG